MQIARKFFGGTIIALAIFLPFTGVARAQTEVSDGYNAIMSQGLIFANICANAEAECPCRDEGKCELSDMMQIFVNISIGILGICGSIALIMFVYGGFLWITSAGNPKKIETGKDVMTKAVIGLAIIFGSYALVNFIVASLAGEEPGSTLEETVENVTN